jgi:hypothetical protein
MAGGIELAQNNLQLWVSVLTTNKFRGLSDRRLSAKLVPTFADSGCRVVSTTDPHGR